MILSCVVFVLPCHRSLSAFSFRKVDRGALTHATITVSACCADEGDSDNVESLQVLTRKNQRLRSFDSPCRLLKSTFGHRIYDPARLIIYPAKISYNVAFIWQLAFCPRTSKYLRGFCRALAFVQQERDTLAFSDLSIFCRIRGQQKVATLSDIWQTTGFMGGRVISC